MEVESAKRHSLRKNKLSDEKSLPAQEQTGTRNTPPRAVILSAEATSCLESKPVGRPFGSDLAGRRTNDTSKKRYRQTSFSCDERTAKHGLPPGGSWRGATEGERVMIFLWKYYLVKPNVTHSPSTANAVPLPPGGRPFGAFTRLIEVRFGLNYSLRTVEDACPYNLGDSAVYRNGVRPFRLETDSRDTCPYIFWCLA